MPRPKQERYIAAKPEVTYFKPQGVPMLYLEEVGMTMEGLEAVRLADLEGLTTSQAAESMRVSRHTFGRILASARRQIALALVQGKALRIEGGHWVFAEGVSPQAKCRLDTKEHCPGSNDPENKEDQ